MHTFRHRKPLLRLLRQVRSFESRPDDLYRLAAIQRDLTRCLSGVERNIARHKAESNHLKHRIRTERSSKEDSRRLKQRLEETVEKCDYYRWLHCIYRAVGDALAFTLFDKWDLKPLAFKESPGFISGKRGASLESRIVSKLNSRGFPAVRCDLTNVLRHGDVAVLVHGRVYPIEVKSQSEASPRGTRQLEAIRKLLTYFAEDKIDGLYGLPHVLRRGIQSPPIDHIRDLNVLIERARLSGSSVVEQVEPGVKYAIVRRCDDETIAGLVFGTSKPLVFMLNDADWTGYYPFCLSIRNPEGVVDFIDDTFVVLVAVDLSEIAKISETLGYRAEFLDGEPLFRFKATDDRSEFTELMCSRHFFGRVAFEFLSLRWLLAESLRSVDAADRELIGAASWSPNSALHLTSPPLTLRPGK